MITIPDPADNLTRQKFRFALVVEGSHSLRNSIVEVLKMQNWFVHGILRAEQALNILAYIPYRRIVVDSELPGMCGMEFLRILHDSREWRSIQIVVMTSSQSDSLATEVAGCGAFLLRKATWRYDLLSFLAGYDRKPDESYVIDEQVDSASAHIR